MVKKSTLADSAKRELSLLARRLTYEQVEAALSEDPAVWRDIASAIHAWHALHWARFGRPRLLSGDLGVDAQSIAALTSISQYAYATGYYAGRNSLGAEVLDGEDGILESGELGDGISHVSESPLLPGARDLPG